MIDIVRDNLGGETTETMSDTRILRYINQAYTEICADEKPRQLETSTTITTTSGTATYEVSVSDVLSYSDLEDDTNNLLLYRMSEWQYRKFVQGNASTITGTPTYWFIDGVGSNNRDNITFFPTPAGTYTINVYYTKKPAELVTSPTATSALLREPWDEAIIYLATSRGWMQLGDEDRGQKWRGMARPLIAAAKKTTHEPSYIRTRPGSYVGSALRNV
jgi:hypothetical protein